MTRREFPRAIKAQIVHRAALPDGIVKCESCGLVLGKKRYEIDHRIAEALVVDKTKPLTADDGQLLGYCCHRGEDGKTAQDVADIARAKRREAKFHGFGKRRSTWPKSKWRKKVSGEVVLR